MPRPTTPQISPEVQPLIDNGKKIPKFPCSNYRVNVCFDYLENTIENWKIDFDVDFQREHVWTREQQISFVEYVLQCDGDQSRSGFAIYLNSPGFRSGKSNPVVCVDGKQRIEAIRAWMRNEFKAFGFYPSDLILGAQYNFVFHVAELETRNEVINWYLTMNRGGTPHSDEEIARVTALIKPIK